MVGCSGTKRDLWNLVSRMCKTGGVSSRCTSGVVRRMASPTRSPVLAKTPRKVEKVWGRREPWGASVLGGADQRGDLGGVKR